MRNLMDLYDCSIAEWSMSFSNDLKLSCTALKTALKRNPEMEGCLLYMDQGSNFTSFSYQKFIEAHGMISSMFRAGCWIDNGRMECFHGIFKGILPVLFPETRTMEELKEAVEKTFDSYNQEYLQVRYRGKRAAEVREEGLSSENPVEYPIAGNPRTEAFWTRVRGNKKQLCCDSTQQS